MTSDDVKLMESWVKALRSGEYKQTQGTLKKDGEYGGGDKAYCCLGVLCDVWPGGEWASLGYKVTDADEDAYAWEEEVGDPLEGILDGFVTQEDLIELNDTYGQTFDQIADAIEESIKVYKEKAQ